MNRTDVFIHAMPAASDADIWRFTVQWKEIVHWARIIPDDVKARAKFICDFAELAGIDFHELIWMDALMTQVLNERLAEIEGRETINRRIDAAVSRINELERRAHKAEGSLTKAYAALEQATRRLDYTDAIERCKTREELSGVARELKADFEQEKLTEQQYQALCDRGRKRKEELK